MAEKDDMGRVGSEDERPPDERGTSPEGLDQDILVYPIIGFVGGIAGLILTAAVVCLLLFYWFRGALARRDPPPPALPEARARVLPPEPRLQVSPLVDMVSYRARQRAILDSYGWADHAAATARIPIDRAIDLYVNRGMRAAPVEEPPAAPQDGGAP